MNRNYTNVFLMLVKPFAKTTGPLRWCDNPWSQVLVHVWGIVGILLGLHYPWRYDR